MNNDLIHVNTLPPFKRLCMTIGELPTSYLESMTYYEMLVWLLNYLEKTVIPTINNNGEAVIELQNKYIELKNYVDNYFDNLDVQEEINNKLDDMAESGELTDIIAQYLGLAGVIAFNTVSEMKNAENLVNGSKVKTLGFYSVNDKGGAFYKVRTITNEDIIDNITIIPLVNIDTLICELIVEDTMSIEQFGVTGTDATTDSSYTNIAISSNVNKLIFNGTYTLKGITLKNNICLCGSGTITCNNAFGGNADNNLAINKSNIIIDGLTFNFNVSGKLYFKTCDNVIIRNCKINSYSSGWNIKLLYCNNSYIESNIIITDEKAYDDGIHVAGENIFINNNYVQNSADISVVGGDDSIAIGVESAEEDLTKSIKNICITNNILKTVSRAINIYSHNQDVTDIIINNNECHGRLRISAESSQTKYLFKNIKISNSSFENENSQSDFCFLINCVNNLKINNCSFNNMYKNLIKIEKYINDIIFDSCNFTNKNYASTNPQDYALFNTTADSTNESQLSLKVLNCNAEIATKILINGANELIIKNNSLYSTLTGTVLFSIYDSLSMKNAIIEDNLILNPLQNQTRTVASINTHLAAATLLILNNTHNFGSDAYYSAGVITKTINNDKAVILTI